MSPRRPRTSPGSTRRVHSRGPSRLVSISRARPAGSASTSRPGTAIPALFTSASTGPNSGLGRGEELVDRRRIGHVEDVAMPRCPPSSGDELRGGLRGRRVGGRRARRSTRGAPSATAMARPIPLDAPVTAATRAGVSSLTRSTLRRDRRPRGDPRSATSRRRRPRPRAAAGARGRTRARRAPASRSSTGSRATVTVSVPRAADDEPDRGADAGSVVRGHDDAAQPVGRERARDPEPDVARLRGDDGRRARATA